MKQTLIEWLEYGSGSFQETGPYFRLRTEREERRRIWQRENPVKLQRWRQAIQYIDMHRVGRLFVCHVLLKPIRETHVLMLANEVPREQKEGVYQHVTLANEDLFELICARMSVNFEMTRDRDNPHPLAPVIQTELSLACGLCPTCNSAQPDESLRARAARLMQPAMLERKGRATLRPPAPP